MKLQTKEFSFNLKERLQLLLGAKLFVAISADNVVRGAQVAAELPEWTPFRSPRRARTPRKRLDGTETGRTSGTTTNTVLAPVGQSRYTGGID